MPIHSIGKQRESLTFSSENYKALIRKYLDTMGYSQITDSFVEGHLSDMIFINPNISIQRKTYVESKATNISIADEELSKELLNYLAEWLNLPENLRFSLFIFTKKINNKKEMEKIFGAKYSVTALRNWFNKYKKKVSDTSKNILLKANFKDVVAFVSYVEIFEMDIQQLTAVIEEKNRHSDLSLEAYAKNLLVEVKRRGKPIRDKTTLISNLVPLTIPDKYYTVKVKFETKKDLHGYFNKKKIEIPPITFFPEKQTISTFADITKDTALSEITTEKPQSITITSETSEQFVIGLINQHLRRVFWKKGLRRVKDLNVYLFECRKIEDKFVIRTCENSKGKEKEVSIPEYKEVDGEKKLNFIFHHAVELQPKKVWDKYYILITPRKEYTLDGFTPIEGNVKDAIDRKFRNPLFNRSSNILSEIRFWNYHLFESDYYALPTENWFKLFKYGNLESIPFDWKPQTVPMGQALLEEFE